MSPNILIVEESYDISLLTAKIFKFQKWTSFSADTAEKALVILYKNDIDIILMDINLPGESGIECCKQIRQLNNEKSKVPIIAVTGNHLDLTLEEYKKIGFSDFLQKPVNFDVLLERMKKLL